MAIQWVVVLITGERNDSLNDSIRQVIEYALQVAPYVYNLTGEHPELTLNRMKIFIERLD